MSINVAKIEKQLDRIETLVKQIRSEIDGYKEAEQASFSEACNC